MSYRENIKCWVCDYCGRYWGDGDKGREWVEMCCRHKKTCPQCGGPHENIGWTVCKKCVDENRAKREREKMDAAELVEYDGPFFIDDRFFYDVDEYLDSLDEDDEPVEYAHVPHKRVVFRLDADDIIDAAIERADADNEELSPVGVDEFREACKAFNEANKDVVVWFEGYHQKFRIPERTT